MFDHVRICQISSEDGVVDASGGTVVELRRS
jgi:hypothetical protein